MSAASYPQKTPNLGRLAMLVCTELQYLEVGTRECYN